MPLSSNPQDELDKIDPIKTRKEELRKRFDADWQKFRGDQFQMPETEGKWDNMTSNRPQSEGWKIINILACADRKLFIPPIGDDSIQREKVAKTERLVNGLLTKLERFNDGLIDQPDLQSIMAFYRVLRGWGAYRCMVIENDDGYPYLDLEVWDFRNLYATGGQRLKWVCYEMKVSEQTASEKYEGKIPGKFIDNNKMVTLYKVMDCSEAGKPAQEGVIIGNEWAKGPENIEIGGQELDYLPVRIKAGGAIPLILDENSDNYKKVGESYLVNTRDLHEPENRMLTYKMTRAGIEAKMPFVIIFNSDKGELPPQVFQQDPYVKGREIILDEAKGQKIGDPIPQATGNALELMDVRIERMKNQGGLGPIAFGEYSNVAMTAFGTDVLNHNTREHIWPFRKAMEQDFVWLAGEIARQYKNGSFQAEELEGWESEFKRFREKIKPKDITADREFVCQIVARELTDRSAHSAMALQEISAGLLSKREALDIHQLSQDPDRTLELISQELAENAFDTPYFKGVLQIIEDYRKNPSAIKKMELQHALQKLTMMAFQQKQEMAQLRTGMPAQLEAGRVNNVRSGLSSRQAMPNVPEPVREAVRNQQQVK